MNKNILQEKSYQFAIKIIAIYKELRERHKEYVLSKQLLRCGTSVGANIEEAIGGQSEKDFRAKISIAYKEARETHYWIRLLRDSDYLPKEDAKILLDDCEEILKISGKTLNTLKHRLQSSN